MDLRFILLLFFLSLAIINDYRERKIKNIIPLSMILTGIGFSLYFQDINLLHSFIISLAFFFFLFFLPRAFNIQEMMGAGDVKLYMGISFLLGWKFSLYAFIYSIFIGVIGLIIINIKRIKEISINIMMFFLKKGKWSIDESQEKTNMFAVYIFLGCMVEFIVHRDWIFQILIH